MDVDQIWLGEFVQKGYLQDLTNYTRSWGHENDWYPASWAAGLYNHKVYGINPYVSARGMVLEGSFESTGFPHLMAQRELKHLDLSNHKLMLG